MFYSTVIQLRLQPLDAYCSSIKHENKKNKIATQDTSVNET